MKHTQGKWEVKPSVHGGKYDLRIIGNHKTVARIPSFTHNGIDNRANANLIAAAPELLQEHKDLIGRIKTMKRAMIRSGLNQWVNDWLNDGILNGEAIAKAEGCSEKDGEEIDNNINDLMGGVVNAISGRY